MKESKEKTKCKLILLKDDSVLAGIWYAEEACLTSKKTWLITTACTLANVVMLAKFGLDEKEDMVEAIFGEVIIPREAILCIIDGGKVTLESIKNFKNEDI